MRKSLSDFREGLKAPLVVVLDDVRSAYNVGSIFRTADAFAIERIICCGITPCPPSAEIHKTALGAEEAVNWEYSDSAINAVTKLKADGYNVLAIEQCEGSIKLNSGFKPSALPVAVVLGNEVKGVKQSVIDLCDNCIEIEQFGTKHSMNVSVTAGIIIWEFTRK